MVSYNLLDYLEEVKKISYSNPNYSTGILKFGDSTRWIGPDSYMVITCINGGKK